MLVSSVPLSETHIDRTTAQGDDGIQLAHHSQTRQRGVGDQRQAFAGEVVDHRQDAEPASIGEGIRQKVQAPALVRPLRDYHRRPRAQGPFAPAAPAHLQPLLAIQPTQLLVVHRHAPPGCSRTCRRR